MDAKRKMLKELKKQMMKEDDVGLGDVLKSKMKVTVAADDPKGLKKGLSKAEEILSKRKEMLGMGDVEELPLEEDMEDEEEMDEEEYEDGGIGEDEEMMDEEMVAAMPMEEDAEMLPKEEMGEDVPEEILEGMSKDEILEKIEELQKQLEKMD